MPASSPPLRIAVLGAGKIGSTFAFQLATTGQNDVTVIARPGSNRLRQLERDGVIVDVNNRQATVEVASSLDEQTFFDLIIVTVLAHQIDAVLPTLQRCSARCILFMFNTFEPERLRDAIGADRCAFGMPFVQAVLTIDGKLKATIGTGGQKTLLDQQRWSDMFNDAGLPATLDADMPLWLRCHTPICVAFESVSVAGMRRGGGASWNEAIVLARGVRAGFRLIKALGYRVHPATKRQIARSPTAVVALVLWSMSRVRSFRELLATGETECCALIDTMVAAGSRATPPIDTLAITAMKPTL